MWPITELADLDYFLGRHRATGHNVWVLLPFAIALGYALYTKHKDRIQWMSIALTFLASHLILDIFQGGATIFYPVSLYTPCYHAEVNVITATNTPQFYFEQCSFTGVPTVSEIYNYVPSNEAAFMAFLIPAAIMVGVIHWRTRSKGKLA